MQDLPGHSKEFKASLIFKVKSDLIFFFPASRNLGSGISIVNDRLYMFGVYKF